MKRKLLPPNYPLIRHIKVPNIVSSTPQDNIPEADWKICSPETAGDFTAAGYFFARELYNKLKIPIGLINTSWGGTMVETWISRQAFENSDEFKNMIAGMPLLNLDSMAKIKKEESLKRIEALQGSMTISMQQHGTNLVLTTTHGRKCNYPIFGKHSNWATWMASFGFGKR